MVGPRVTVRWARVCPSCGTLNTVVMTPARPDKAPATIDKYTCGDCGKPCPLPLVTEDEAERLSKEQDA